MCKLRAVVVAVTGCLLPLSFATGANFTVQAGSFPTRINALSAAEDIEQRLQIPVSVRAEQVGDKSLQYKVLVGDYPSRTIADETRKALSDLGLPGFIRSTENYDAAAIRAVLGNESPSPYFQVVPGGSCIIIHKVMM